MAGLHPNQDIHMIAPTDLFTFMAVVLGLFLVPGPAVLLVITRTAQGGRRTGILTGLGIAAGDLVHTLAAAVGLSALLATSAFAFTIVKFAGAAYLLYLGVRAIAAKPATKTSGAPRATAPAVTPARAFWQAIPAEVLNPKTALFFLAFMPQFVRADHAAPFAQFAVFGLVFVAMSAAYTTLLVFAIGPIGRALKRVSWLVKWQGRIIGSIFIALGLKVAMQKQ
jgi:threonine/homoserine/homoserine lactone efflux protein